MNSMVSRLDAALAYPRAVDDFVELVAPLRSTRELRARIVAVRKETHDVATLLLAPSARLGPHRAGQHVLVGVEIDGVRRTRCFSIASAEGQPLAITVKARPGGVVTPRLVSGELRGALVTLSQPAGDFVLPEVLPERILLVSGGSGITPVMSMLRTLALRGRGYQGSVSFAHWARSEADVIYRAELAELARSLPIHVLTGPFDAGELARRVPDVDRRETWACGPPPFLEAVRSVCPRTRVERFTLGDAHAHRAGEGEITFVRSKKRAKGKGPILLTAEGAGLTPPSGCRQGICGTCKCRKVSGVTRDLRTGELSSDADVDIQLCVSAPVGPVAIDL